MGKRKTFADKVKKVKHTVNCDKCSSPITPTLFMTAIKTEQGTYKYKKNMVNICKCNHKEYYG